MTSSSVWKPRRLTDRVCRPAGRSVPNPITALLCLRGWLGAPSHAEQRAAVFDRRTQKIRPRSRSTALFTRRCTWPRASGSIATLKSVTRAMRRCRQEAIVAGDHEVRTDSLYSPRCCSKS